MTSKTIIMLAVLCAVAFISGGNGYPQRTVSLPVLPPGSFGPFMPMGSPSSAMMDGPADPADLDDNDDMDPLDAALNPFGTMIRILGGGGGGGGYKKTLILG